MSLEQLRKKHGFTQQDLAVRLNVDKGLISKWEHGLHLKDGLPHRKYHKQLQEIFKCPLDELKHE